MTQHTNAATITSPAMKRTAFALLWLALSAQIIWLAFRTFHAHVPLRGLAYSLTFTISSLLLALTSGRVRWIATLLRLLVALAFLQAVGDRFGFFGGPGTPGVAWGDFAHFIAYTATVNAFLPSAIIPTLAVLATIAESTLGVTMLLGIYTRAAAIGSAALLFAFATAMAISGLSQFAYAVYVMAAGAQALATVDAPLGSVDALLRQRRKIG